MTRLQNNYRKIQNVELEDAEYSRENDINVGVITFAVTSVVLILVAIFFIKTYASQKQEVLETLNSESAFLETFCRETFDHNLYVLKLMGGLIKDNPEDLSYIDRMLKHYSSSADIQELFAWKEFIWIDKYQKYKVSSKSGIMLYPSSIDKEYINMSKDQPGRVLYWTNIKNNHSGIPLIYTLIGLADKNGEYIGSLAISYDIRALNSHLTRHKGRDYTNFILFDENYRIIMQSKPVIRDISVHATKMANANPNKILNSDIESFLHTIGSDLDDGKAISYIDMLNGTNYHIKKIKGEHFILLINIDKNEIQETIFHSIVMKFLEISIFASMFFVLIIAIYKRETWLRAKAEKAYQVALMATKAKSDFLAFTAHEIRSPLGFIMTGSELMCKKMLGPISQEYLNYLEGIHKSAEIILEFINDILDEEHIIAGNFKIVETQHNITEIIDTAIKQNMARYANRNINIIQDVDKKLPLLVCDARRILQVINNLLSNSIKYSQGEAEVIISTKMRNGELFIKIRDHGIGMTEAEIKVALTKYGTVYKAPFSLIESYGLGLAIVKLLLDAHEASFCVESEVNVGTTVTIIFPKYKLINPKKTTTPRQDHEA